MLCKGASLYYRVDHPRHARSVRAWRLPLRDGEQTWRRHRSGAHPGRLCPCKALGLTIATTVPSPIAETLAVMLLVGTLVVRCRPTEGMARSRLRCPGRCRSAAARRAAAGRGRGRGQEPRPDHWLSRRRPRPRRPVRPLRPVRGRRDLDGERFSRQAHPDCSRSCSPWQVWSPPCSASTQRSCCSPRPFSRRSHGSGYGPSLTLMPAPTWRTRPRCSCPSPTSPTSWRSAPAG